VKIYFQPNANVQTALRRPLRLCRQFEISAAGTPLLGGHYSASTVPVIQIGLTSDSLSEQPSSDFGNNFIRTQLATVPGRGAAFFPYGGKQRQNHRGSEFKALHRRALSPVDIVNAGERPKFDSADWHGQFDTLEYNVEMNGSPQTIQELNDLPVKTINGATIYMREVAHVRDGFSPQTNIVRATDSAARFNGRL